MLQLEPAPIDESDSNQTSLELTIQCLCERSLQLQEYSRRLKERSQEINRRVQAHLNTKRGS